MVPGSILHTCSSCGKNFLDAKRKEEAIDRYLYLSTQRFRGIFIYALFGLFFGCTGIALLLDETLKGLILLSLSLLFICLIAANIILFSPKRVREQFDNATDLSDTVVDSLNRLRNPEYLKSLTMYIDDIPDWFYERINLNKSDVLNEIEASRVSGRANCDTADISDSEYETATKIVDYGKSHPAVKEIAELKKLLHAK